MYEIDPRQCTLIKVVTVITDVDEELQTFKGYPPSMRQKIKIAFQKNLISILD